MRETEILVEQQPPQGVLVCDHAGLVINKFSHLVPVGDWVWLAGDKAPHSYMMARQGSHEDDSRKTHDRGGVPAVKGVSWNKEKHKWHARTYVTNSAGKQKRVHVAFSDSVVECNALVAAADAKEAAQSE